MSLMIEPAQDEQKNTSVNKDSKRVETIQDACKFYAGEEKNPYNFDVINYSDFSSSSNDGFFKSMFWDSEKHLCDDDRFVEYNKKMIKESKIDTDITNLLDEKSDNEFQKLIAFSAYSDYKYYSDNVENNRVFIQKYFELTR